MDVKKEARELTMATELRELTTDEIEVVSGGTPELVIGPVQLDLSALLIKAIGALFV